jgi:hypothetical protein
MRRAIPPLTPYAFMVWYSVKAQGQLYLYLAAERIFEVMCVNSQAFKIYIFLLITVPDTKCYGYPAAEAQGRYVWCI